MIGLPCVTASPADVRTLKDLIERNPETEIRIDLVKGTCDCRRRSVKVSMPPNVRDALITGAWDTTGLLLDRYDEVDAASHAPAVRQRILDGGSEDPPLRGYLAFPRFHDGLRRVFLVEQSEKRRRGVRALAAFRKTSRT